MLSACSISYWERYVVIYTYESGSVFTFINSALYTLKAVSSCWIDPFIIMEIL